MAGIDIENRKKGKHAPDRSVDALFFGDADEDDDFDDLFDDYDEEDDDFEDDELDDEEDDDFEDEDEEDDADESPAFARRTAATTPSVRAPQPTMPGRGRRNAPAATSDGGTDLSDEALMEADLAKAEGRRRNIVVDDGGEDEERVEKRPPDIRDPWRNRFSEAKPKPQTRHDEEPVRTRDAVRQDDGGRRPTGNWEPVSEPETVPEPEAMPIGETEQLVVPRWVVSIDSKLNGNVAHAFLLEGNIRDYMVRNISIKDGIIMTLDPEQDAFDVIASYDQAHGLTFDTYSMEENRIPPAEYRGRFIEMMHEAQERIGFDRTDEIPHDPVMLFSIISKIIEMPGSLIQNADGTRTERAKLLLFVDYPEMLIPQSAGTPRESERQLAIIINDMCRSELADQSGCCIIMMTDDASALSERVRSTSSRVDRVNVPMPLLEARKDFIYNVLSVPENSLSDGRSIFDHEDMGGVSEDYLAINTAGLAAFQIEDIVLRALADDMPITPDLIKERKNEIIMADYNEILEIMEPKYGFKEIGGMQQIKEFFTQEVIEPIHRGELEGVPMGVLLMGPPGTAKGHFNKELIVCQENGVIKKKFFGDLTPEDMVFDRHGQLTEIQGVFPLGKRDLYKVTLQDGRSVLATADHRWGYWHCSDRSADSVEFLDVVTTEQMIETGLRWGNGNFRYQIPLGEGVHFPQKELPMDPYTLGALIGDGCTTARQSIFASADEEIVQRVAHGLGASGYQMTSKAARETSQHEARSFGWKFSFSDELMQEYIAYRAEQGRRVFPSRAKWIPGDFACRYVPEIHCLAHEKRIPEVFKLSSIEQRKELVRGLMDTHGSVRMTKGHRLSVQFTTTSEQLAKDIREVLFSLGIAASLYTQHCKGKVCKQVGGKKYYYQHDAFTITLHGKPEALMDLFGLRRKQEPIQAYIDYATTCPTVNRKKHDRVSIVSIEKMPEQGEATCIKVASEEELFLVTEGYICSHNTLLSKAVAKESGMNCVNLNLNRILSKYVGGSEHNLDRALDCAMAMEPTIIFIDEIDEALPKRNGMDQTGISQRINKRLLEFMSNTEHRGQVMILAATNYPEKIDPAFKRAGRFDNRLPMFAPGKYDRARILHISAAKANYTISSFLSPDTPMTNPFRNLREWLPIHATSLNLSDTIYDMTSFEFPVLDHRGNVTSMASVRIPVRLYDIMQRGNGRITLEEFYRTFEILVREEDLPRRGGVDMAMMSTEQYREALANTIRQIFVEDYGLLPGDDPRWVNMMARALVHKNEYFDPFDSLTTSKTGAELDVVINKCISIYRKWKISHRERYEQMLANEEIAGPRDIPWFIVLEACEKTTSAVSGIKMMEDFALIDTSDTDYIPDEEYGILQSATPISYRDRQEQLLTRLRSLAGDESAAAMEELHKT